MENGAAGPAPPADARATISCGGSMAASPFRRKSSSSSSSHLNISCLRGGRTGTFTGADWWYGAAGPALFGLGVIGMARAAEVGDWVGDNEPPPPDAEAAAAAMVALRRSSVPAEAAAAAAAPPPPPPPRRSRSLLSPSCNAARSPTCPCGTRLGLPGPSPGRALEGGAAGEDENRKSSSWSSSPATNDGSVGDDDGDANIPMNRSLAGDRRGLYSSMVSHNGGACSQGPGVASPPSSAQQERATWCGGEGGEMKEKEGQGFVGVWLLWGRGETRRDPPPARGEAAARWEERGWRGGAHRLRFSTSLPSSEGFWHVWGWTWRVRARRDERGEIREEGEGGGGGWIGQVDAPLDTVHSGWGWIRFSAACVYRVIRIRRARAGPGREGSGQFGWVWAAKARQRRCVRVEPSSTLVVVYSMLSVPQKTNLDKYKILREYSRL